MTLEEIKTELRNALANLGSIEGVSPQAIEAAVISAANPISTAFTTLTTERDEAVSAQETAETSLSDLQAENATAAESGLFKELGISEKAVAGWKAYIPADKLAEVKDSKGLEKLIIAAAKASDGTLAYTPQAKGAAKSTASASPFEKALAAKDDEHEVVAETESKTDLGS